MQGKARRSRPISWEWIKTTLAICMLIYLWLRVCANENGAMSYIIAAYVSFKILNESNIFLKCIIKYVYIQSFRLWYCFITLLGANEIYMVCSIIELFSSVSLYFNSISSSPSLWINMKFCTVINTYLIYLLLKFGVSTDLFPSYACI